MKKKQALYTFIGNFVYLVAQWALTVVVVRCSDDFYAAGLLALAMTIANVFYIIACYGIRTFQISDINHEYSDQCYLFSRVVSISAALIACLIFLLIKGYAMQSAYCVYIYMIYKCFEAASDVIYGVFQINDDYEHICISMSIKGVLSFLCFTAVLVAGGTFITALWSMNIVAIITYLLIDVRICKNYVTPMYEWNRQLLKRTKKLLWITMPAMVILICQPLLMSIPRLYFERYYSTELLGIYSSVSSPTVAISTFVSSVIAPYIPLFAEYFNNRDRKNITRLTFGILLFTVGIGVIAVIGASVLGEWVLRILYGNVISEYVDLFIIIIIVTTCSALMLCLDSLYIAIRKLIPLMTILLLGCILCWIVTPYLVSQFDMNGVAYSLLVALLFQIGASLVLAFKYINNLESGSGLDKTIQQ